MIYNALSFSFLSNNIVHIHITWSVVIKILHYLKCAKISDALHSAFEDQGGTMEPANGQSERLADDRHLGTSHCTFKIDI